MITREFALSLIKKHCSNKNLLKHMIAVEGIMRRLARRFQQDETLWGMTGLLHDLDYDLTADDFPRHGFTTAELLQGVDVPPELVRGIVSHTGHIKPESTMEKALYAADPISGLIVASALMHPTKKLSGLDTEFILRRFGEKRFAAGADREQTKTCADIGLSLEEFAQLSLEGMVEVAGELGL
jgi:putative nucleotidyltransferase with HDIG domain